MTSLVGQASSAKLSWIRYDNLFWSDVEPTQGDRQWSELSDFEQDISSLSSNGLNPVVIVRSTPNWAQKKAGYFCGPIAQDALDDFANFMRDVVTRYSAPPYNVTHWELGNQPNLASIYVAQDSLFGCWGEPSDSGYGGGYYAEMLKKVYPAIKQADPNAQVLIGGLSLVCDPVQNPSNASCQPAKFLEGILQNGGGDYFDIVSYHGYAFWSASESGDWDLNNASWQHRGGVVLGEADFLREVLTQYGFSKPLLLSEASLVCHEGICPAGCHLTDANCPPEAFFVAQANYAIRLYSRIWANGLLGGVWYELGSNNWRYSDMIRPRGNSPQAYTAVQFMAPLLEGATYHQQLSSGTTEAYSFKKGNKEYQIYWTNETATTTSLSLPANTQAVYDKLGQNITPAGASISVGFEPIIIEVGP